jgi:hypothetical protein
MKVYRLLLSIALVGLFAIPTEILHGIFILPELVEHFEMHQKSNEKVDPWDYVVEHLAHHDNHDHHNQKKHDHSPFHHHHASNLNFATTILAQPVFVCLEKEVSIVKDELIIDHYKAYTSLYVANMWQPPKVCS